MFIFLLFKILTGVTPYFAKEVLVRQNFEN